MNAGFEVRILSSNASWPLPLTPGIMLDKYYRPASILSLLICKMGVKVSPIPGILQARTLEWVAISFSNA